MSTILGGILLPLSNAVSATDLLEIPSYSGFGDSPQSNYIFDYFYLDDFEDGLFNVPGVTGINNTNGLELPVGGASPNRDSVENGSDGFALSVAHATGSLGATFTFDPSVLGSLPTFAGIVWTDGNPGGYTQFSAYDGDDNLVGLIDSENFHDNSFAGTTTEDRFFGVFHEAGIARFTIRDPGSGNGIELDHLQYGGISAVPLPAALWLFGTALLGLVGVIKRGNT